MRVDILTLFPSMFMGILKISMLQIAIQKRFLDIRISNIRNFTYDKHHAVDDRPYSGGPGMLMKPEPIYRALEAIWCSCEIKPSTILFTPQGKVFNQNLALEFSKLSHIILICGHYEGFDERIRIKAKPIEISIGDYILTGGEIPAMVFLDSVVRLVPGVLGSQESTNSESFSNGLLEYPQYTRPPEWRGMKVPDVLISGHHKNIEKWKKEMALKRTKERRPDLIG